jgi:hypothetical protein
MEENYSDLEIYCKWMNFDSHRNCGKERKIRVECLKAEKLDLDPSCVWLDSR